MHTPRVLIVDDDAELSAMLVCLLEDEGWAVATALTGAAADAAMQHQPPDVVLLDVLLPDANGLALCRRWHASRPDIGILMLSARGDPIDRVLGLELGADDYLPKPFERRELVARLRALLRRKLPTATLPVTQWVFGALTIHLMHREVLIDGQLLALSSIEFKLLLELARRPGEALSREQLSDAVQAGSYRPLERTVDVQVGRLRRRLASMSAGADWIETVRGEGYAFVPREPATGEVTGHAAPPP